MHHLTDYDGRFMCAFFLIAIAFSWTCWATFAASQTGCLSLTVPVEFTLLGEYGPTIAAFGLAALRGGGRSVRSLLGSLTVWRVGPGWYAFALGAGPLIMGITIAITVLGGGEAPAAAALAQWPQHFRERMDAFAPSMGPLSGLVVFMSQGAWTTFLGMLALAVSQGGLSEEPGWRGYAMELGMKSRSLLVTAIMVGMLWALWHMSGPSQFRVLFESGFVPWLAVSLGSALEYLLLCLPLAVLYAWLYANTRSVLLAILMHAAYNMTITVIVGAWPRWAAPTFIAVTWLTAGLIVVSARRQFFDRPSLVPAFAGTAPSVSCGRGSRRGENRSTTPPSRRVRPCR